MSEENVYGLPELEPDFDEIERQLDLYEKGRRLRSLTNSPDWELVTQILKDYKDKARDALDDLPPGDPNVMQAHAAVSATKQVYVNFLRDINSIVSFANNPPEAVKLRIFGIRKALDVQAAMGQGE